MITNNYSPDSSSSYLWITNLAHSIFCQDSTLVLIVLVVSHTLNTAQLLYTNAVDNQLPLSTTNSQLTLLLSTNNWLEAAARCLFTDCATQHELVENRLSLSISRRFSYSILEMICAFIVRCVRRPEWRKSQLPELMCVTKCSDLKKVKKIMLYCHTFCNSTLNVTGSAAISKADFSQRKVLPSSINGW